MTYNIGFVMEQTLGHLTHCQNLRQWVDRDPEVEPTWIHLAFEEQDGWSRTPIVNRNWTLRSSLRARERLQAVLREKPLDALMFHTQVTALFAHRLMRTIPTVVSMDATPLNFDRIGRDYAHVPSRVPWVEPAKNALSGRTFRLAQKLITWHEWGKESLITDYGVNPSKVAVISPGVDMERWHFPRPRPVDGPVRLLFVGGDFRRKGGDVLLTAFRTELAPYCELDIVTREETRTDGLTNVRIHHGIASNSPKLLDLYARADVFVFPTLADVLPIAIMEAMASGLPVVTTHVGAINEQVEKGVTGLVVPPGDARALSDATMQLVKSPQMRRDMGAAGRLRAAQLFNGSKNYAHVLAVCKSCADLG